MTDFSEKFVKPLLFRKTEMSAQKQVKSKSENYSSARRENTLSLSSRELKFIVELGRSLLFTVHPKKVAPRVAEAIRQETGANICALAVELEQIDRINCAFLQKRESSDEFSDV